ncbi:MAG: hypothetical protein AAF502_04425 [Bacteroidota bacterium]
MKFPWYFSIGLMLYLTFGAKIGFNYALAYALFSYLFLSLVDDFGKKIPVLKLIALLATVQWVIVTIAFNRAAKYNILPVPEEEYINFAVPGVFFFCLGLLVPVFRQKVSFDKFVDEIKNFLHYRPYLGIKLFIIGVVCSLLEDYIPGALAFVFVLLRDLMFIGGFYTLFSPIKNKIFVLGGVLLVTALAALQTGMFGTFVFWLAFSALIIALTIRLSYTMKLSLMVVAFLGISIVQSTKQYYRLITWRTDEGEAMSLVERAKLLQDIMQVVTPGDDQMLTLMGNIKLLERLNQGSINAAVLRHVPRKQQFVDGETILTAIPAVFVPRIVWPDKPVASSDLYTRFTGYPIAEGVSMSISPLGEGYVNFGKTGCYIYLFIYGFILNFAMALIFKIAWRHPTIILWIPLMFFMVVKVETQFLKVFNHLVKSSIFVWLVFSISRNFFKVRI